STRYRIPAGLAASIHDIALAEGLDPWLAFQLVRVESGFSPTAVSPKGAVGLTQIMPSTAEALAPGISHDALFEPETNLRLGFRYLRYLIERYGGDLRLALLAYNRGPGTVDAIRSAGGDPSNGYAEAVMGNRQPGGTLTARASVGASPYARPAAAQVRVGAPRPGGPSIPVSFTICTSSSAIPTISPLANSTR